MRFPFMKTPEVCRELGIVYHNFITLMRMGIVTAPAKDCSGDYVWLPADVERARKAVQEHAAKKAARKGKRKVKKQRPTAEALASA